MSAFGPFEPRRWQADALPQIVASVRQREAPIVSAVMGAGKSVLLGALAKLAHEKSPDKVVVISAPRKALVRQLSGTVAQVSGAPVGRYFSDAKQLAPVVVTCNMSLASLTVALAERGRRVSLLIQDEAHSSEAASVKEVVPQLAPAGRVGFTATPFRSTHSESLSLWDRVVYRYTMGDAMRDGVLVPWRTVSRGAGDSLISLHEPVAEVPPCTDPESTDEMVYRAIMGYTAGPGVVSAVTISDAEAYAAWLDDRGIRALAVHSKLGRPELERRIGMLRDGELRALVHVSLLAEGVDFPWLRWLAFRRPVNARVRFMQELGRPLRCHPGKTHAVIIDPHDLLGLHGTRHPEALGEALQEEADKLERRAQKAREEAEHTARLAELPAPVAVDRVTLWARSLSGALEDAGLIRGRSRDNAPWRDLPPTKKQLKTLASLNRTFGRYIPSPHRESIRALAKSPHRLQSGAVSDLVAVLVMVANDAPRHWSARHGYSFDWPENLRVPALDPDTLEVVTGDP